MKKRSRSVKRVFVDRRVLCGFRRRALRCWPREHIEALWGRRLGADFYVHAITDMYKRRATRDEIEYDPIDSSDRSNAGLQFLGSLHTHPESSCTPSDADWEDFAHVEPGAEKERIMGIMGLSREYGRQLTSVGFWDQAGHLELVVSEAIANC